ncbi:TPA: hypothetical protein ACN37V_004566, partial [Vibrio parahaemolyticus]
VNIFNPNTRVLKTFTVKMYQEILPNGEILFPVTAVQQPTNTELEQQLSDLLDLKESQHEEVLTVLAAKTQLALLNDIYIPESIASSPWDLVGSSYKRTQLGNFLNPSIAGSYWESPLAHNGLVSSYLMNFVSLGVTELLDLNIFTNKLTTLTFKSGATITFELTGFATGNFEFEYKIKYPIVDSSGNVVADSSVDLKASREVEGSYLFGSESAIDRAAFEHYATSSNWVILGAGGSSSGGAKVCYSYTGTDGTFTLVCSPY